MALRGKPVWAYLTAFPTSPHNSRLGLKLWLNFSWRLFFGATAAFLLLTDSHPDSMVTPGFAPSQDRFPLSDVDGSSFLLHPLLPCALASMFLFLQMTMKKHTFFLVLSFVIKESVSTKRKSYVCKGNSVCKWFFCGP